MVYTEKASKQSAVSAKSSHTRYIHPLIDEKASILAAKTQSWYDKTGEDPRIFPNFQIFQNCARCEDLKNNKHNSFHLGRKYAGMFVLWHYLCSLTNILAIASIWGEKKCSYVCPWTLIICYSKLTVFSELHFPELIHVVITPSLWYFTQGT